jgi:NAD+---dinitrogen-reductase ADP-D-ribosyltransferase
MNDQIADAALPTKHDTGPGFCSSHDNSAATPTTTLPTWARLPINRCNLPAIILGSLTFQRHPTPLALDGIAELHADLFELLDQAPEADERARLFRDYMAAHFCLDHLEEAGFDDQTNKRDGVTRRGQSRTKANWLRVLRGWGFDADGREGAVLKGWVESRFGLLPRFHGEPLRDFVSAPYLRYLEMRSAGLYGTNALEAQLDLLYAYSQCEFARSQATGGVPPRLTLYRGINHLAEHEVLEDRGDRQVVLFNNLVSFTRSRERASEFGDYILEAEVPTAKIFFHCGLLPEQLKGEDEHLVIGGVYEVAVRTL